MRNGNARRKGQVLLMVTFSLVTMIGMLGLAVDLGFAFITKKSAQTAADAAAMAAAIEAYRIVGRGGNFSPCPAGVTCAATDYSCPPSLGSPATNLDYGCLYAQRNGFADGGRQMVKLNAGVGDPPDAPGVRANYWVTARVSQTNPLLFTAIFGHREGTAAARATAAIAGVIVEGSIILTNRSDDASPFVSGQPLPGVNLHGAGGGITVPGGILMASSAQRAGTNTGSNAEIRSAYTHINETGWVDDASIYRDGIGNQQNPINKPDGTMFTDPLAGIGQPPAAPNGGLTPVQPCPISALIDGSSTPVVLGPGDYYTVDGSGNPTGEPITLRGDITFGSGGTCLSGTANASGFGSYSFFGGLTTQGSGTVINVDPGRYFIAGRMPKNNGDPQTLLDAGQGMSLVERSGATAGAIFVLTDPKYPSLIDRVQQLPANVQAKLAELKQGPTNLQSGSQGVSIRLRGLNGSDGKVEDAGLTAFDQVLFWQDQRNSSVRYDSEGNIECGNDAASCAKDANRRIADGVDSKFDSTEFKYQGSPTSQMNGIIYQPRGAYMTLQGGGSSADLGKLRIVTGALVLGGGGAIAMQSPEPITQLTVSLVR